MTSWHKALDAGAGGAEALNGVLCALSAGLRPATPASMLQKLQNFAVTVATTFKVFLEKLVVLVTSVQEVDFAEDGTLRLAVKACQFATLSAPMLHGRNARASPHASVAEFLVALEDSAGNLTPATASTRARGGRAGAGARGAGPLLAGREYGSGGSSARSGDSVHVVSAVHAGSVVTVDQCGMCCCCCVFLLCILFFTWLCDHGLILVMRAKNVRAIKKRTTTTTTVDNFKKKTRRFYKFREKFAIFMLVVM